MDKNILNEVYKELYDAIGEEAMFMVYNLFRGQQINFPMRLYDPKLLRNAIIQEYNGSNISYLACKYGYSERSIIRTRRATNGALRCSVLRRQHSLPLMRTERARFTS